MNSKDQYLLLKRNKMLLFLIVHLSMYDISYVHHCNNTSSSHRFAKLLKNTEGAFPIRMETTVAYFGPMPLMTAIESTTAFSTF